MYFVAPEFQVPLSLDEVWVCPAVWTYLRRDCNLQCQDFRDGFAKALYQELFDWLLGYINELIRRHSAGEPKSSIGILDIFGFENFEVIDA